MENPSLQIGGGDWAVKETKLLGTNPVLNRKIPVEIDVTNATIGTRVNKQGFIENGPRNLLTFSETFDNAVWVKNDTVVLSTNNANPFGKLNATKLGFTLQNNPNFQQVISTVPGKVFTTSFYVRRVSGNATIYLRVGSLNPNNINPTSVWQRFSVTGVTDSTTGRCTIGAVSPVLGVDVIEIWGAQLEENSIATEYYPTTTRTNLARIDYSSGEAALLIEPQRTNIAIYSEDFANLNWQKLNLTVTANQLISPKGTIDTSLAVEDSLNTTHQLRLNNLTVLPNTIYTLSLFVKKTSNLRNIKLVVYESNYARNAILDLDVQTKVLKTSIGAMAISSRLTNYSNDYVRHELTFNTATNFLNQVAIFLTDENFNLSYQGNGISNVGVFGAQLEVGSYATSYIPTLASAVTRNADLISKTGISSLINSQEGVLLFEGSALFNDLTQRAISITDGTNNNIVKFFYHNYLNRINYISISLFKGGNNITNIDYTLTFDETLNAKFAFRFKENEFSLWVNGLMVGQRLNLSTFFSLNTLNVLELNTQPFRGKINQLQLYKTALTDAQLITLTTI